MKKIKLYIFAILLTGVLALTGCVSHNYENYDGVTNVTENYKTETIFMEVGQTIEFDFHEQFKDSGLNIKRIDVRSYDENVATANNNKISAEGMGRTNIGVTLYNKDTLTRHFATSLRIIVIDRENMTEIRTAQDLADIALDNKGNYIIKSDIDLNSFGVWTPIDSFEGMLVNPDGYKIKNLTIFSEILPNYNRWSLGLFGGIYDAYIDGLILENVFIDTSSANVSTGAIAGNSDFSTIITNCIITGTVIAREKAGGFIGEMGRGTVIGCSFNGTVKAVSAENGCAGGISAYIYEATVEDCIVEAIVDASFIAGGVLGFLRGGSYYAQISNCEFTGQLLNAEHKGDIFAFKNY